MTYQLWDTLQVLCNDLRGIVLSQAALLGQGVGSGLVSPLDVVRDDMRLALLGNLLSLVVGSSFRSDLSVNDMKRWRIYNAIIQFLTALLLVVEATDPRSRFASRAVSTFMSSTIGVMGAGVSTALVMHLSKDSLDAAFKADVGAKEGNQDRILQLCTMLGRLGILFWVGTDLLRAFFAVLLLTIAHVILNAFAVQVLALRSLNAERAELVLLAWESKHEHRMCPSPSEVAKLERLCPRWRSVAWPSLIFCTSLEGAGLASNEQLTKLHEDDHHVISGLTQHPGGFRVQCLLKVGATGEDVLKAAFHAHYIQLRLRDSPQADIIATIVAARSEYIEDWRAFQEWLEGASWITNGVLLGQGASC
mmetsp:Transcript_42963/g.113987  ORF Transcript_42963/g.113987 Transcript_42963/m.113987 type:complete len:363 (+) Transcript_42963:1-1089(+)